MKRILKMKKSVLNWLLKDDEVREIALNEIIGDAEVKTVSIENSEVTLSNCYLIDSTICDNEIQGLNNNKMKRCNITYNKEIGEITNNIMEGVMISNNTMGVCKSE